MSFVRNQLPFSRQRADKYATYVKSWANTGCFVGWHWFQYMDQPKAGRPDGEDSNFGLVTIEDEPYDGFIPAFKKTNQEAWALHEAAGR